MLDNLMLFSFLRLTVFIFAIATPLLTLAEDDPYKFTAVFLPLPEPESLNKMMEDRVALGKRLFNETKLSESQKVSCNSCHALNNFGVDKQPTATGHDGQKGDRNTPTVFNVSLQFKQFWDGRAEKVENQNFAMVLNHIEMPVPIESKVVERLKADPDYLPLFEKAFPDERDPISLKNVGRSIGAFEKRLVTPSRFDKFLKGDPSALSDAEKKGIELFVTSGCSSCHFGATVGGQLLQKLGLVKEYKTEDLGRFKVTKKEDDKYFFKVPSLRNVSETSPYFHDGSVATLDEAVKLMAVHQIGRTFSDQDVKTVVEFLKSLKGELPQGLP